MLGALIVLDLLSIGAIQAQEKCKPLDKKKIAAIAVQRIPKKGIGLAINDRLERAANIK